MHLSRCTMKEAGSHSVSLLASLNLQRRQAQFCDCVVTQTQSPAHFYLAHRCILAASSPVLASLLLSSGALLELQAPCLSDSVLEVLLDYIYTGTLHLPAGQQEYSSLRTAATYLEMDELHHALRDRQCDELNSDNTVACNMAQNRLHSENIDTHIKPEHTWYTFWNKTCSAKLAETRQLDSLGSVELEEALRGREEEEEERTCSPRCSKTLPGSPLLLRSTFFPPSCPSPHRYRGDPSTSHASSSSSLPSCETVPVICHSGRSTSLHPTETPTLPLLCPAAQPSLPASSTVITSLPVPRPASPAEEIPSNNCKDIDKDRCGVQNWGFKDDRFGIQNCNYSDTDSNQCGMQSSTGQCETTNLYHKKHFGIRTEDGDRRNCGLSHMTGYEDHLVHSGLLQDDNSIRPNVDGISESKDYRDFPDKEYRDYKECGMDLGFDKFPVDRLQVQCSVAQDAFMATAEDTMDTFHSQGQRLGSGKAENIGGESHHEDHCLNSAWEREEEGENHSRLQRDEINRMGSCSSQPRAMIDRMHSASSLRRVMVDGQNGASVLHRADTDRRDSYCSQHRAMTDRTDGIDDCLHTQTASTTLDSTFDDVMNRDHVGASDEPERGEPPKPHPSLEFEKISDSENAQPNAPIAVSVHSNMHEPAYNTEGHSYHGHLRYQCLSREHTPSYVHPEHTHSPTQHSGHLPPDQPDYSSDWEGTKAYSNPGSPLTQHCTSRTGVQLLLLDISSKLAQKLGPQRAWAVGGVRGLVFGGEGGAGEKGVWPVGGAEERGTKAILEAQAGEGGIVAGAGTEAGDREVGDEGHVFGDEAKERGFEAEVGSVVGEERGATSGTVSKVEGVSPTASPPVCWPTGVPASHAPTSLAVSVASTQPACVPPRKTACVQTAVHHPYQCTMCERSFSQRGSLNRHMRSHLGVRPYPCPRCPMTFSRQYRVTEHMRVHQRNVVEDPQRLPALPS